MRAKVRVVQVIPSMNVGGREKVVLDILRGLDGRFFDVEVACLSGPGSLYRDFMSTDRPVHFLNKRRGLQPSLVWALGRLFRKREYEVVHTHNPGAFTYGAIAAKIAGTRVVVN